MNFDVKDRTIFYVRHGSHAYGTNIEGSDEDFKGICVAPFVYYISPFKNFEQSEKYVSKGADKDEVIYNVDKFIQLAANANPNILEVLFVDDGDVLLCSELGRVLRGNSNLFITKKIRRTMAGYAYSQAARIKTHRQWLLNPPKEKPTRELFKLSATTKLTDSEMGAYEKLIADGETFSDNVMWLINQEKKYASAKREWDHYNNWKATRNKARAELEAKYGYDSKHAYHLVRLMRMAKEVLEGKGVIVKRPDREELIHIRNGGWTYDELMGWFEKQESELDVLYEKSKLPFGPNFEKIEELLLDIIRQQGFNDSILEKYGDSIERIAPNTEFEEL